MTIASLHVSKWAKKKRKWKKKRKNLVNHLCWSGSQDIDFIFSSFSCYKTYTRSVVIINWFEFFFNIHTCGCNIKTHYEYHRKQKLYTYSEAKEVLKKKRNGFSEHGAYNAWCFHSIIAYICDVIHMNYTSYIYTIASHRRQCEKMDLKHNGNGFSIASEWKCYNICLVTDGSIYWVVAMNLAFFCIFVGAGILSHCGHTKWSDTMEKLLIVEHRCCKNGENMTKMI